VNPPGDVRTKCAEIFATITQQQATMLDEVKGSRNDIREILREQSNQGSNIKSLWHVFREDVKPELLNIRREFKDELKTLQIDFRKDLKAHTGGCPAHKKAMKRAEDDSGDRGDEPSQVVVVNAGMREESMSSGPHGIPKIAWIVGATAAVMIATALWLVQKLGLF